MNTTISLLTLPGAGIGATNALIKNDKGADIAVVTIRFQWHAGALTLLVPESFAKVLETALRGLDKKLVVPPTQIIKN